MCLKVCKTFKSPTSIIDPGVKVGQLFTFLPIFRDFKEVLSTKIRYVLHYLIIFYTFERSNRLRKYRLIVNVVFTHIVSVFCERFITHIRFYLSYEYGEAACLPE